MDCPKVSVIIPVFNVECYIERCADSLMKQTLDELEMIFVNDCTLDKSMRILESVIAKNAIRSDQVKIINHERNLGLPSARLSGLLAASGEFVIYCDSDDWVEPDMYEKMYLKAESDDSDIVVCDVAQEYVGVTKIERLHPQMHHHEIIKRMNAGYRWYLCNKLVKRDLIITHQVYPLEGINMWEDVYVSNILYYYAKKVSYVDEPLYHYNRLNESSITKSNTYLNKWEQESRVVESLKDFFMSADFDFSEAYTAYRIVIKDRFLNLSPAYYKMWRKVYPEIAEIIIKDKSLPLLYRSFYYLAQKGFVLPFVLYRKVSSILKKSF